LHAKLKLNAILLPAEMLSDEQIAAALAELVPALARLQVDASPCDGMPDRLFYEELLEAIEEDFELLAPGTTLHLDGCTGYCPDCVRWPWCENGLTLWAEDEEAGCMAVSAKAKPYVAQADLAISRLVCEDF